MKDALVLAKRTEGMDVFNALQQMENGEMLSELKFGIGDGNLNYDGVMLNRTFKY